MKNSINYLHTSGLSGHRPTKILLIGAGGNGSLMLSRLYKMHVALTALGQPGFDVSLCDPDTVSSANMGRQPFFQSDIGANKAETLIWRLCGSAGDLSWTAIPRRAECEDLRNADMVITCVDTISSRRQIHQWLESSHYTTTKYWLDMGNEADTGQVVLGQIEHRYGNRRGKLPTVAELVPAITDPATKETDTPSCSVAEALEKQDLFINEQIVMQAATLLWELFSKRMVRYSIVYINVRDFAINAVPIQLEAWKRLGIHYPRGLATSHSIVEMS